MRRGTGLNCSSKEYFHIPFYMGKQVYSDFHIQIRAIAKLRDNPISRYPEKAGENGPVCCHDPDGPKHMRRWWRFWHPTMLIEMWKTYPSSWPTTARGRLSPWRSSTSINGPFDLENTLMMSREDLSIFNLRCSICDIKHHFCCDWCDHKPSLESSKILHRIRRKKSKL